MNSARILIVDDDEVNLRVLRRVLEREGYEHIRTTNEGRGAVALAEEFQPDLIVLDLHMPAPDGFQILRLLAPRPNGAPVLALTGDDSPETRRIALSLGARDFLEKPFDNAEAMQRIRSLLETRFRDFDK